MGGIPEFEGDWIVFPIDFRYVEQILVGVQSAIVFSDLILNYLCRLLVEPKKVIEYSLVQAPADDGHNVGAVVAFSPYIKDEQADEDELDDRELDILCREVRKAEQVGQDPPDGRPEQDDGSRDHVAHVRGAFPAVADRQAVGQHQQEAITQGEKGVAGFLRMEFVDDAGGKGQDQQGEQQVGEFSEPAVPVQLLVGNQEGLYDCQAEPAGGDCRVNMNETVLDSFEAWKLNEVGLIKSGKGKWNEQQEEIAEVAVSFFHFGC